MNDGHARRDAIAREARRRSRIVDDLMAIKRDPLADDAADRLAGLIDGLAGRVAALEAGPPPEPEQTMGFGFAASPDGTSSEISVDLGPRDVIFGPAALGAGPANFLLFRLLLVPARDAGQRVDSLLLDPDAPTVVIRFERVSSVENMIRALTLIRDDMAAASAQAEVKGESDG